MGIYGRVGLNEPYVYPAEPQYLKVLWNFIQQNCATEKGPQAL